MIEQTTAVMGEVMDSLENHLVNFEKLKGFFSEKMLEMMRENKKLVDAFEDLPISVYWKDKHGRFIDCNQEMLKIFNIKNKLEIIGKTDVDILSDRDLQEIQTTDQFVLKNGKSVALEEAIFVPTHSTLQTYRTYKRPIFNELKQVEGLIGISINITEQKNHLEMGLSSRVNTPLGIYALSATEDVSVPMQSVQALSAYTAACAEEAERCLLAPESHLPLAHFYVKKIQKTQVKIQDVIKNIQLDVHENTEVLHQFFENKIVPTLSIISIKNCLQKFMNGHRKDIAAGLIKMSDIDDLCFYSTEANFFRIMNRLLRYLKERILLAKKGKIFVSVSRENSFLKLSIGETSGILPSQATQKLPQNTIIGLKFCSLEMQRLRGSLHMQYIQENSNLLIDLRFPFSLGKKYKKALFDKVH